MSMKLFINFLCCRFLFSVNYRGLENLKEHQCLICPNHSSNFDPFFIYPVSSSLSIMAKAELFKNPILSKLLKHYNVFPVDRSKKDPSSLLHSIQVFNTKEDRQLLIFPEGGVLKTEGEIGKRIRNGATYISAKLSIPIIPTYITRRPSLFSKVTVTFGKPFNVSSDVLENKEKLKNVSKELIETIYSLKI